MTSMQTLAWSLLHFLWQGAAIAGLAAALMFVFRKPGTRYLLGVGALAAMLLAFGVTYALLGSSDGLSAAATAARAPAAVLVPPGTYAPSALPWTEGHAVTAPSSPFDFTWLARGWLAGVFLFALRIAFGLFIIEQLRRRNLVALPPGLVQRFEVLQARIGISRGIRYAQCALVNVPAVIGFVRPVVLIPVRALTGLSAEQLDALIAHELGHIKRFDVAVNFAQVVAETLFFFHPAVWWLNRRIRADREDCCDDIAVAAAGSSVRYAKALAAIVGWSADRSARRGDVPALAMAATGGPVAARVARLLGVERAGSRTAGVFTASLVLTGALVIGAVSLGITGPARAQSSEPAAVEQPPAPPAPVTAIPNPVPAARVQPLPTAQTAPRAKPVSPAASARTQDDGVEKDERATSGHPSYIEEMRAADIGEIDVDELVALRMQGVTRQYIQDIRATGLKPSVDEIIGMKMHGVTPNYVRQVRAMGFDVDADQLIGFRMQGISSEFVQQVRSLGFKANADEIVAMKMHGVSPDYVQQMRALGLELDADQAIAMRVHGITPGYVKQMRAEGFQSDTGQLIALKVHAVTPEYRKSLESAGFRLDPDELVHAKVMSITPEFIAKAASHGFKDLNIDQLIALKNADVL